MSEYQFSSSQPHADNIQLEEYQDDQWNRQYDR